MPVPLPDATTRWRCTACGNLTRFDVARSVRSREFVHVDLAGTPVVESTEVVAEVAEHVTCRWCNAVDHVELVPRPGVGGPPPDVTAEPVGGGAGAAS